ncbi:MAG: zinc ABC transporter substrate-binding protein, partial [Kiritimatiellae bacterium]|nr:zinc ABC transporter substrate-binding protein [Kiritimatiellia bacterium]
QVDSLLGPGQDPHVYEPTPRQVSALAASRFFFRTGMPFEDALAARAAAKYPGVKIVALEPGNHEEHDHGHGHDEAAVHGWLSPHNLEAWAHAVADEIEAADPAERAAVERRLAAWIDALDAEEAATRAAVAGSGVRAFVAWHPAYGAWAGCFGLEQIALEADGKQPGPRTLAAARERIAATGAKTMLVQNGAEAARAAEFARDAGLRVAVVPPLGDDPLETLRLLRGAVSGD